MTMITPTIAMYETNAAILLHGKIPGVQILDADVREDALVLTGTQGNASFAQTIRLPVAVNPEGMVCVQDDDEVRIALPRQDPVDDGDEEVFA